MNNKLIYIITILLSVGVFFVLPVYDDFYYLTAPHKFIDYNNLLPNGAFWRPIDAILGYIIGRYPWAFPFINHTIVIGSFAFAIFGLKYILNYCHINKLTLSISLAFFCLSPALVATTYSIDSSNQTMSLALGIASLIVFQKHKVSSYVLMIFALFSKESGIAWFAITPLLNMLMQKYHEDNIKIDKHDFKPITKYWSISFIILAIYAIARISLNTQVDVGHDPSSRYSGGLGLNSITGLFILLSLSTTTIDTIAMFLESNYFLLAISCIASLLFVLVIGKKTIHQSKITICLLLVSILATASPHLVMKRPGEMHLYPVLWTIALSIGILAAKVQWIKTELVIIYCYLIVGIFVFIHKAVYIYNNGKIAETRVKTTLTQIVKTPKSIMVLDCDKQLKSYSVFQIDGKRCWDSGKGTRIYLDLENPQTVEYHIIKPSEQKYYLNRYFKTKNKFEACWIVRDNKVKVIY